MQFEWDQEKAQRNERKHGVSFLEACAVFCAVFDDDYASTVVDPDHSEGEVRYSNLRDVKFWQSFGSRAMSRDCFYMYV